MGLFKFIAKRFKCSSNCTYDPNNEIFCRKSLSIPLEHYELKFKDIKKIMKILNKRNTIKLKSFDI